MPVGCLNHNYNFIVSIMIILGSCSRHIRESLQQQGSKSTVVQPDCPGHCDNYIMPAIMLTFLLLIIGLLSLKIPLLLEEGRRGIFEFLFSSLCFFVCIPNLLQWEGITFKAPQKTPFLFIALTRSWTNCSWMHKLLIWWTGIICWSISLWSPLRGVHTGTTANLFSVFMDLSILYSSRKWNHIICGFFHFS